MINGVDVETALTRSLLKLCNVFLASKKYIKRQKINPAPRFPLFPDSGMCESVALSTKNQQMTMVN
jgi:hypothetical protein